MIDKITYLETDSEKFPLAFTLNVMESIQDEYGTLSEWSELIRKQKEPNIKALKFFITEAINEGIDIENEKSDEKLFGCFFVRGMAFSSNSKEESRRRCRHERVKRA